MFPAFPQSGTRQVNDACDSISDGKVSPENSLPTNIELAAAEIESLHSARIWGGKQSGIERIDHVSSITLHRHDFRVTENLQLPRNIRYFVVQHFAQLRHVAWTIE